MRTLLNLTWLAPLALWACNKEVIVEPPPPPAATIPSAPVGVTATPGASFLRVSWSDRSSDETGFVIGRVELASANDTPTIAALTDLETVTADQLVYRDEQLLPGKLYAYGVAAQNGAGRSAFVLQDGPPIGPSGTSTAGACRISVPSPEDVDGDGLADEIEADGWTVRVDENGMGAVTEREVSSVTSSPDFDEDGLCDALERILRTDPNRADTDGDGLSDADEVRIWGSSPINVDSDADATGNTAFYDGSEITRYGTSPTLADTDGDGRSDFVEINQNSTNALLADLPRPELGLVGDIDIGVNVRLANGSTQEDAVTAALTQGTESATNQTNSVATTVSSETSVEVSAKAEVSFPAGASVSVSASYGQTDGYMREHGTSLAQSSESSSQEAYERATSREVSQQEVIESGRIAVNFQVSNAGNRTFELSNLVVTALTRDRGNPKSFTSVATLHLPDAANMMTLSDGESRGPFRAEATIPANVALDLLSNPSGLYFRPASFQLKDRTGQNFEFSVGETTSNRTALLVIDYGGGRALETYRVATNVARRDGGKLAGVRMGKVLEEVVGLAPSSDAGFRTALNSDGVRILTQVRDQAVQPRGNGSGKFWVVIAAENATSGEPAAKRLLDPKVHFEDLILMPRDRVYLSYEADEDSDGLYAREERLHRTSDTNADSDGDGLGDLEEIREGWKVFSTLPFYSSNPLVYSSPTRADADSDNLTDPAEKLAGTDPNRADTDGDGLEDDVDPQPLSGLSAPYIRSFGTVATELPSDIVVDAQQNIYILGSGSGDLDGDGYVASNGFYRSSFIGSWDSSGNKRWIHELETLPNNNIGLRQSRLLIDENDHLWWLERLNSSALSGVTADGEHLVELDADGNVLSLNRLSYPANQGYVDGFVAEWFGRVGNQFAAVGAGTTGVGSRVAFFDNAGLVASAFAVSNAFDFTAAISSNGVALISGCTLQNYSLSGGALPGGDYCGTVPQIHRVETRDDGTVFLGHGLGAISKFNAAGGLLWTNSPPPSADGLLGIHVDVLGRSYVLMRPPFPSQDMMVRGITPGGSDSFLFTVPGHFTAFVTHVDRTGNLFILGSSDDGLGGRLEARGGEDLVVLRNPQLLFE